MADSTLTQAERETDLHKLHETIRDMDALAQGGFSEIAAIARLSLIALESPKEVRDPETIAQALHAIWSKALDIENSITATAGEVGCEFIDDQALRRYAAVRQAREDARHG